MGDEDIEVRRGAAKALTNLAQGLSCHMQAGHMQAGAGREHSHRSRDAGGTATQSKDQGGLHPVVGVVDQQTIAKMVETALPNWHLMEDEIIAMYLHLLFLQPQ